ncbi:hypothetical protein fNO16VIB93_0009 [Vibrio phage NO16-like VIB93]|nr:hypothetical protein fNO16VIB93_0009 [Vibrio phage NO16-like VIB93]QYS24725.1 hypothetical protein fNO16VIB88_0009 [Vibrio phage NO16-like VIB88]QYS24748.1 hypothetical protein fNO16VIB1_0009 [Vibrio phage NO16-like VIB1]
MVRRLSIFQSIATKSTNDGESPILVRYWSSSVIGFVVVNQANRTTNHAHCRDCARYRATRCRIP